MKKLGIKFKTIIVVSIIFLSTLIIGWNFDLRAKNLDNEKTSTSTSRYNESPRTGGFDWGKIEVISEPVPGQNNNKDASYAPKIAVENDKIYVVWTDATDYKNSGGDEDIFYRYFDGNQWSDIQVISEPITGKNFNTETSDSPDIAVENGKIYVVWADSNNTDGAGTDFDIFYRCNLTGSGWENIQVISESTPGSHLNNMASFNAKIEVANGKIYVVWNDYSFINNAGGDCDIFFRCNLTSASWEDLQIISEPEKSKNINILDSMAPDIAVEDDKIYVTWQDKNNINNAATDTDIFYRCNITGNNWEEIQVISEPIPGWNFNIEESEGSSIIVENGKIYVVWYDYNNTNGAGIDGDIFYRCNFTGVSWEPIEVISEPVHGNDNNKGDSICPRITVENGKIYVVWCDYTNIYGAGTDGDIFYRRNITSVNWEDIQIISEPVAGRNFNTGGSYYSSIAINLGKNHIVWYDCNNTNSANVDSDIFYLSIFSPLVLGLQKVTPVFGNTSTDFKFTVTYYHLNNIAPSKIIVNINNIEYSMLEVDPSDPNCIDGKNYFFNIKNLDLGSHTYQFYASDGKFNKFTALLNGPNVYNTPPIIITEDILTAFEDFYYEVNYQYEDIDKTNVGQTGTWKFSTNAKWLTFDKSTALLYGTPTNDDVGKHWVNISIDDTIDSAFTNFTLTIINVNDAPVIITNETNKINEDKFYEVNYDAIDIDTPQNNLNWCLSTNASWLKFDQESVILYGLPENNDVGEFWINISVSDGEYIDFSNFTLNVINVNDPPKIITKEIAVAYEDSHYIMNFEAEDIDNVQHDLSWTINTNAKWLRIDNINLIINGTPTNDDIGEYWINLSVSDREYSDDRNFTLKVENTNDPPKIIVIPIIKKAVVGELYSIQFNVEDIDPSPTIFTWFMQTNTSNWLSNGPSTGLLFGEPSESDIGTYWVNVSVTDNEGGWDCYNFTLEVLKSLGKEKAGPFISSETLYWTIWIVIIIMILIALVILLIFRKHKQEVIQIIREQREEVIQTVRAELLPFTPTHLTLPGESKPISNTILPAQPMIIDQLSKPETKALPTATEKKDEESIKVVGTTPISQQFQLPKATLSKEQQLNLLRERFLKGEVIEVTFNKLRSEIEGSSDKDITDINKELKEQSMIGE